MAGHSRPLAWAADRLLGVLIVAAAMALFVPIAPLFPTADVDGSWAYALNVAVERGLVFGRDVLFTFGPFGIAYTEFYYPSLDTMMLLSAGLLGAAFVAGLLCLTAGWIERLGALLLVALMGAMARDAVFFALPLTLLVLVCRVAAPGPPRYAIAVSAFVRCSLALLVMALSLLGLVKGTFAVASGMVMALSFGLLLLRGQKGLAVAGALLFAGSMPVFWVLAGQPLAALPGFFHQPGPDRERVYRSDGHTGRAVPACALRRWSPGPGGGQFPADQPCRHRVGGRGGGAIVFRVQGRLRASRTRTC